MSALSSTGRRRILGIDPGLRCTGWGVIDVEGTRLMAVAHGTVTSQSSDSLAERLVALHKGLQDVCRAHNPDEAAVEQTFVNRDAASALKLGQARGIALLVPASMGLPVSEYAPNTVKKSVVGAGHADKTQIAVMVAALLPGASASGAGAPVADAADALAVAITHAHHGAGSTRIEAALAKAEGRS